MTPTIPARRMQLVDVAPRQYGAMFRFSRSVELDHGLRLLIEIRASQINSCAFCLDMHWKDARAAGESEERLYMLSAWRESSLYSERERAALELCEAMTEIAGRWRAERCLGAGCGRLRRGGARPGGVRDRGHQHVEPPADHYAGGAGPLLPGMFDTPAGAGKWTIGSPGAGASTGGRAARPTRWPSSIACVPICCGSPTAISAASARPRTRAGGVAAALARATDAEIRDLRAWLTTVISRLAIDALTSARARREHYVGPWLPEPLVQEADESPDPALRTDLDEDVSMAMLIVLESLSPAERSAFLLHDVFGYSFEEVARIVEPHARVPAARWPRGRAPRWRPAAPAIRRAPRNSARSSRRSSRATQNGDLAGLLELLDPSVTFRSDGGGLVPAARTVFTGARPRGAHLHGDVRPLRRPVHRLGHHRQRRAGPADEDRGGPERRHRDGRRRADHLARPSCATPTSSRLSVAARRRPPAGLSLAQAPKLRT